MLRDLEWLLNTRRIVDPAPDACTEVQNSVYHFGLPDITSLSAESEAARLKLVRQVEAMHPAVRAAAPGRACVRRRRAGAGASASVRFIDRGRAEHRAEPGARGVRHRAGDAERRVRGEVERPMRDDLLYYYERELAFLRRTGAEFGAPLPEGGCAAPARGRQVRRPARRAAARGLRVPGRARTPQASTTTSPSSAKRCSTSSTRTTSRPHPVACRWSQFVLDPEQGKLTTGLRIPQDTDLYSRPVAGDAVPVPHVLRDDAVAGDGRRGAVGRRRTS